MLANLLGKELMKTNANLKEDIRNVKANGMVSSRHSTTPISIQLMRSVSGLCCEECNVPEDETERMHRYDLDALRRQNSSTSPLVLAPMSAPNNVKCVEQIITDYIAACRFYGCGDRINAGVLTTIRFSLPSLRLSGGFHDADMLALSEIMFRHANNALSFIHRLDFSLSSKEGHLHGRAGFRSHGALALAKILQCSEYIKEVNVKRNRIGSFGASALFLACSSNPTLEKLGLEACRIGERGALAFAEIMSSNSESGLRQVDLSGNYIGFKGAFAIEECLQMRRQKGLPEIHVDVESNLVFAEVMNGVTHGVGMILALVASVLLSKQVENKSQRHVISCGVYSASLMVLYLSSTLFHSLFALRSIRWVLRSLDKSAIYILIAGTYTPFLQIVLANDPLFSTYLLAFLWICCVLGIWVEAFQTEWKYRSHFSLLMYLSMGWSALTFLPTVITRLPPRPLIYLVLGGVSYTAGVPFFVRNNNLDHAIWHVFVLAGSIFHWWVIYRYVAPAELGYATG
jgi:hemolysin III